MGSVRLKGMMKGNNHYQHCKNCKQTISEMLCKIFGEVKEQHRLNAKARIDDYISAKHYEVLMTIYVALQRHRGHLTFVRSRNLPPVDYFLPRVNRIIEYDEAQHFTTPRALSIENYPPSLKTAYDTQRWAELCRTLDRHDTAPIYRDEQRAWYDTLRDFAPAIFEMAPTGRIFAADHAWCSLDVSKDEDVELFIAKAHLQI